MKNCWWKFKSNVLTIIFRFAVVCHENENFKFVYMDKYFILQIREYQHCFIQIDAALRSHHIHADTSTCKFCKMKYWYFLIIRITTRNMVLMDEKVAQLLVRKKTKHGFRNYRRVTRCTGNSLGSGSCVYFTTTAQKIMCLKKISKHKQKINKVLI